MSWRTFVKPFHAFEACKLNLFRSEILTLCRIRRVGRIFGHPKGSPLEWRTAEVACPLNQAPRHSGWQF